MKNDNLKKDLVYLLIICGILIIILFSNFFYKDDMLVMKFEFAATITSIILAVLAIIMTITEGYKNAKSSQDILDSSQDILKSSNIIRNNVNELNDLQIKNELIELKNIISSVEESLCTKMDFFMNDISTFKSNPVSDELAATLDNEHPYISDLNIFVTHFLNGFNESLRMEILAYTYYLNFLLENHLAYSYAQQYMKEKFRNPADANVPYIIDGVLHCMIALRLLSFKTESNTSYIAHLSPELVAFADEVITSRNDWSAFLRSFMERCPNV